MLSVENVFLDDEVFEVASLLLHACQAPHEDAVGEWLQFDVLGRLAVLIKHHVGHPLRVLAHVVRPLALAQVEHPYHGLRQ